MHAATALDLSGSSWTELCLWYVGVTCRGDAGRRCVEEQVVVEMGSALAMQAGTELCLYGLFA